MTANVRRAFRRWIVLPCIALSMTGLHSCVTAQRYKESQDTAKLYQRMVHDLELYQDQLEAEVDALRSKVALGGGELAMDATYASSIDARLEELKQMEARIAGVSDTAGVSLVTFEGGYGYRLQDSVLFDSGSSEVRSNGKAVLAQLAREIKARPYVRVWVRGHTDSDPIVKQQTKERYPHGNLELSAARSVEVASLLVADGVVDMKRVVVAGLGPNEPVVKNDSAENKQKNRRVEIFVEEEKGAGGR